MGDECASNLVSGQLNFMLELYRAALSTGGINEGDSPLNFALSPVSIAIALAVVSGGAAGKTLEEMLNVLRLPTDVKRAHPAFALLHSNLLGDPGLDSNTDSTGAAVRIATGLWVTNQLQLQKEYENHVAVYNGRLAPVDFILQASQVRDEVNEWVSEQTSGKILEIVPEGVLCQDTVMLLVNALYFKGLWQKVFDPLSTTSEDFTIAVRGGDTKTVSVPMMKNRGDYRVGEQEEFAVLCLPYEMSAGDRRSLAMYIFLPNEVDGLAKMEESLTDKLLEDTFGSLFKTKLRRLLLPKFKISSSQKLNQALKAIGMQSAFEESSDFSNLFDAQSLPIFLSHVLHNACVEVDEEGTVAAAATAAILEMRSLPVPCSSEFIVDHPFLFMIRDDTSGLVLFVGRVIDPRSS